MHCSNRFILRAKAPISSASLREAIVVFLKDMFFTPKAVSDVNGVVSPKDSISLSLSPSVTPHTGQGLQKWLSPSPCPQNTYKETKHKAAFSQTAAGMRIQSAGNIQKKKGCVLRGSLGELLRGVSFDLGLDEWI